MSIAGDGTRPDRASSAWHTAPVEGRDRRWSRRELLGAGVAIAATGAWSAPALARRPNRSADPSRSPLPSDPFTLGVASGDPAPTSVVLWTRLTGMGLPAAVDVTWEAATDESFGEIVATGIVTAVADQGHSVHVTATIDTPVRYRFRAGGFTSAVGWAAPVPADPSELRLATASCQNFQSNFYAAHRDLAEWRPDLVAFLGDFIYEGAAAEATGDGVVRLHEGPEPTDLVGYRARYATYLGDPHLQAARAVCPWLVVWDDHEVENNYAGLTPQDPAETPSFAERRAQAYQAWWEHQPVRLPPPTAGEPYPIYRSVAWGGLADLLALDGRQFRSPHACNTPPLSLEPPCDAAADPARTMLGDAQEAWLGERLAAATATWPALVQQTVLTDLRLNGAILNEDQWDGYAPARERLLAQGATAERLVVLTGDIHLAGVASLPGVGVEFVTSSIASHGNVPADLAPVLEGFEQVVAAELLHRGYTRHTVTTQRWTAEYRIVEDAASADSAISTWQSFTVDAATRDVVTVV